MPFKREWSSVAVSTNGEYINATLFCATCCDRISGAFLATGCTFSKQDSVPAH